MEFFVAETKGLKKNISVAIYGGSTSVDVQGDNLSIRIQCGSRKKSIQNGPA